MARCAHLVPSANLQSRARSVLAMAMTIDAPVLQQAEPSAPAAPSGRLRRYARPALGLLLPVGLALGWEMAVSLGWSNGRLVPPPTRVFATIMELAKSGELTRHIMATLTRVASGFFLGVAAGTILGAISGYWGLARRLLDPTVQALRAIPSIAWVPLFILWLGIFETSKIALIAVGVFFPVYLGVMGAILSVDRKIVEVGRTFRLSWLCDDPPHPAAGGAAGLCGFAARRPRSGLDVRRRRGIHGRLRRARLSPDRRPAARQARADPRRHRHLRHPRQDHRLADRDRDRAAAALAGRFRRSERSRLMLALDRVGKTYPNGVNALERFSADIRSGEIAAIIGGSGCGKSTLLRAIAGLDPATTGRVTLDDIRISAPHEKIGIIFQEPRLLPWLSVADNIGFGLSHLPAGARREKVARALTRVGLADKANAWPRELSGGQAQRVAIARALVPQPEVLLLDEPFSALDAFTRRDLQDHLLDLWADTRPTLILVTHDVDEAVVLADRVLVMRPRPGRLFEEIKINLARPRDRNSPHFDNFKRRVLTALDRSLDRNVPDAEAKANTGEAMWW